MIRVFVVDDHPLLREGVKRTLAGHADVSVCGEADSGTALLDALPDLEADVVLLDVSMPGPPFFELLKRVGEVHPDLPLLVLSGHPEEQYAVRCLREGAAGYLNKQTLADDLLEAVRRVAAGGRYVAPELADALVWALQGTAARPRHESLSRREFQVLQASARGTPVKVIARDLGLSPKTVSTYRRRIREKLALDSQAEVIRYAVEHGLVPERTGKAP